MDRINTARGDETRHGTRGPRHPQFMWFLKKSMLGGRRVDLGWRGPRRRDHRLHFLRIQRLGHRAWCGTQRGSNPEYGRVRDRLGRISSDLVEVEWNSAEMWQLQPKSSPHRPTASICVERSTIRANFCLQPRVAQVSCRNVIWPTWHGAPSEPAP